MPARRAKPEHFRHDSHGAVFARDTQVESRLVPGPTIESWRDQHRKCVPRSLRPCDFELHHARLEEPLSRLSAVSAAGSQKDHCGDRRTSDPSNPGTSA